MVSLWMALETRENMQAFRGSFSSTMYGNNYDGRLYLPDDIETTCPPEQDPKRDFSTQGSGAFPQFTGYGRHPNAVPTHMGPGPPPPTIRSGRAANSFEPPTPTHGRGGMRAISSPQLPYGNGPALNHPIASDLAALVAKVTLRQDHLDQENQLLKRDNNALHARISSFESRPAPVDPPPSLNTVSDPREAAAVRKKQAGRRAARKERGVPPAPPIPSVPDADCPPLDPSVLQQSAHGTPFYLGSDKLPPELVPVRTATQKFVSKIFRDFCGVGPKDEWPDPSIIRTNEITNEQYLTPNFAGLITDTSNQYLIAVVARKAEKDLRR
ncbi:hypothetical protein MVEN_00082900 [Mycena venus]|uniref:Uncharacterized protein n=1 Tax=Mycena venus TaxID=2733690 RepID=A0A8H7DE85_9AGAR|nr:hypothetical protein MVEN_00082900 [Mycena venus]